MVEERRLDEDEVRITEDSIKQHEKDLRKLKFQEKRAVLNVESIPLVKEEYADALSLIRGSIKETEMAIKQAKRTLERR